jgi:lauroyl/myristoyl acyltransferase
MSRRGGATHEWHALHLAGAAVAAAVRLVPRRWRFNVALVLARAAQPFLRNTEACRRQLRKNIDGIAEIALYMVTNALTVHGTEFVPRLAIEGYDEFVSLCRKGGGVLLVQPHAVLTQLPFRAMHDDGLEPIGMTTIPHIRYAGTRISADALAPSRTFLVTVRNRLREGRLVSAMIDRAEHSGDRTVEFATANGPLIVSTALLRLAVRCGARVAFTEVHMEGWRVAGSIVIATSDTVDGLTREFADFVRSRIAARFGSASKAIGAPAQLEGVER